MAIPPSEIAIVVGVVAPGALAVSGTLIAEKLLHARRGRHSRRLRLACFFAPPATVGFYALVGLLLGWGDPRFGPIFFFAGLMAGALAAGAGLLLGFLGRRFVAV